MDRINALRAKQGKVVDDMEALLKKAADESRDLNDAEKQAFKDFEADLDRLKEAMAFEQEVIEVKAALAKPIGGVDAGGKGKVAASPKRSLYGPKLKAFKEERFGSRADAEDAAYRSGMWCRAVVYGDENAAQWCAENDVRIARGPVTRSQNEGTNTAGGFLAFPEMETAIIDLRETYGTARRFLNVRQMASDVQIVPRRTSGLTGYFAVEENAFTESSKAWAQVKLTAQALGALTKISRELADDAVISVADDIASEMAYALATKEDATLWNGDATAAYGGITGIRTKFTAGVGTLVGAVDAASGHDLFSEYDAADLLKVIGTLPKFAEPNARWYGHRVGWANTMLRLLAAAGGNSIIDIQAGGKPVQGYLGYPFETDQTLPSTITALNDQPVFLFGDIDAAVTMGERRGFTFEVDNSIYFLTRQIALMGWERIDINVHDIGDTSVAGPLVALMANT